MEDFGVKLSFSSPGQAVLCWSSKIKDKVRARKHAYILIQTREDFLLQSASESVLRAERHLFFPLLVSTGPTTKHCLALMQSRSTQRINNLMAACHRKEPLDWCKTFFFIQI